MSDIEVIKKEIVEQITNASDLKALDDVRVNALGKKGRITELLKTLGSMPMEERIEFGKQINAVKAELDTLLTNQKQVLETKQLNEKLKKEVIDVTLPCRPETQGRIHPISKVYEEVVAIFSEMGFEVADGPEIEDQFHNFNALNTPPNHPARQMQDTFYVNNDVTKEFDKDSAYVVRTQTSSVQIRTMEKKQPPIRIIAPGRTYRSDYDATHTPMFHQVEGLVVDKKTTMADLKGCLYDFMKEFFEVDDLKVRFRPSFFPFTEPSAEMDIGCLKSKTELKIGTGNDWLEVLGCGMVHPNVLKACGIDPEEYQGFAFGVGMDRLAMLKYGIPDLRTFFESDVRWIKNYGFAPLDISAMTLGLSGNGGLTR
ncbi:MAG: phenylalanine--tRNA ligase subunit alpha [Alphaproteobacteria bacterium]|nr:phenylalanine--tRNA ligase subunit alpha [Alphaproteobacteria bacterium]